METVILVPQEEKHQPQPPTDRCFIPTELVPYSCCYSLGWMWGFVSEDMTWLSSLWKTEPDPKRLNQHRVSSTPAFTGCLTLCLLYCLFSLIVLKKSICKESKQNISFKLTRPSFEVTSNQKRDEVKARHPSPANSNCANKGMGAQCLAWFTKGPRCYRWPRCQALMGNRGRLRSLGTGLKVLGSRLPTAPWTLGQIHAAQSENIWRESVKMASSDVG